jgi:hypothetical protein
MSEKDPLAKRSSSKRAKKNPSITHPGSVQRIIKPFVSGQPEKAEIALEDGDELYREIRIENTLTDAEGKQVALKQGAEVDVTVEADPKDTVEKPKENQS